MGSIPPDHYFGEEAYRHFAEVYEMPRPFTCDRCNFVCVEEGRLMWHRKNAHLINDDEE